MFQRNVMPVFAAALALSACGGDSGSSKSAFIEEADAICRDAAEQVGPIAEEEFGEGEPTAEEVLALVERLIPLQRETIADVRALDKPEGEEGVINDLLDQADAAADRAERKIDTPQAAVAAVKAVDTPQDPFYESNQAMAAYGFEDCSN